jgi:hypothetical protein
MNSKILIALFLALAIVLSGCTTPDTGTTTPPTGGTPTEGGGTTVDLCAAITCPDKCEGFVRLSEGHCVNGACTYDSAEEKSSSCGYHATAYEGLDISPGFDRCVYNPESDRFHLYMSFRNDSTNRATQEQARIELLQDLSDKKVWEIVNASIQPGRVFFEETKWDFKVDGRDFRGAEFLVESTTFDHFNFSVIYCELDSIYTQCTEENGIVLYEGNTATLCTTPL